MKKGRPERKKKTMSTPISMLRLISILLITVMLTITMMGQHQHQVNALSASPDNGKGDTSFTSGRERVLVVMDTVADKEKYSIFFKSLKDRGFSLTYHAASDSNWGLIKFDELVFDHLILFAPSSNSFKGDLTVGSIIDFQKKGGNVLVAGSSQISEFIRDLGIEYSLEFDEKSWAVCDPFHALSSATLITSSNYAMDSGFLGSSFGPKSAPVVFQGVGHRLSGRNKLAGAVVKAHASAHGCPASNSKNYKVANAALLGSDISLVSALQAWNNARIVFSGSVSLFSDELIKTKLADGSANGNFNFATEISKWVLQEKNVLRVARTFHHRETESKQHGAYRIKDDIVFEIDIAEYKDNQWVPYHTTDLQFEAVMLDPYIRHTITDRGVVPFHDPVSKANITIARYKAHVKLPDVYGVFTFKIDHLRHGKSFLQVHEVVSIHPFRHNEYPRFLSAAFPYYVNSFSMIVGFFVLSAVVLYHGEDKKVKEQSKVKTN